MVSSRVSFGKFLALAVVSVWLVLVGVYVWRNYVNRPMPASELLSAEWLEEEWYSVLFKGKKAGWIHNSYDVLPDGYLLNSMSMFKLLAMGVMQKAKMNLEAEVDPGFRLRKFKLDFSSEFQNMLLEGEIDGRMLTYRLRSPKDSKPVERKMKLNEPPSLMDMVGRKAAREGLEVGQKFRVPVFDPITQRADGVEAEVVRNETIQAGSKSYDTHVVRIVYLGMEMYSWLDDKGRTIKSDAPLGLSVVLVSKAEALQLEDAGKIDVVAASAVPVNMLIPDPRGLKYLNVRLRGVKDLEGLDIDGGHQRLEGAVLEVEIPAPGKGYRLPDDDPDREAERSPEDLIQSDDPDIIAAARKAGGGATNSVAAARNINRWVFTNLEKSAALTIPSAREVLDVRKGDCNEHTQLFVAMARALGLPARTVVGVVYLNAAFYYHAWPEVWLGKEPGWTPVDPTFGQFPADATHLRLVVGALKDQANIMRFMGKLKIDVIEYR